MENLHRELKEFIIATMNLEDITIDDIGDDTALFGDTGLGLDSIDALELVLALKKNTRLFLKPTIRQRAKTWPRLLPSPA